MEENKEKLIIDFGQVEYSPAIIDYDFIITVREAVPAG